MAGPQGRDEAEVFLKTTRLLRASGWRLWSLEGTGATRSFCSGRLFGIKRHEEILSFHRYLLNTYNEGGPGDTSVNKARRLRKICTLWPLATSPWSSPLGRYTSATLAFLSILESIEITAVVESSCGRSLPSDFPVAGLIIICISA